MFTTLLTHLRTSSLIENLTISSLRFRACRGWSKLNPKSSRIWLESVFLTRAIPKMPSERTSTKRLWIKHKKISTKRRLEKETTAWKFKETRLPTDLLFNQREKETIKLKHYSQSPSVPLLLQKISRKFHKDGKLTTSSNCCERNFQNSVVQKVAKLFDNTFTNSNQQQKIFWN